MTLGQEPPIVVIMIDNPLIYYFSEVLGVKSFISPSRYSDFGSSSQIKDDACDFVHNYQSSGSENSQLMVISFDFLRDQERELLGKMLQAIQIENYYLVEGVQPHHNISEVVASFKGHHGILFGKESYELLAVKGFNLQLGQTIRELKVKWLVTLSIGDLIGHGSRVMERKRQVWEHLKSLQRVL